jgi:serine/threonine-protein kinase HipA
VNPEREFFLLAVLGADLSGAIVIAPLEGDAKADDARDADRDDYRPRDTVLRFSFAGVQLSSPPSWKHPEA